MLQFGGVPFIYLKVTSNLIAREISIIHLLHKHKLACEGIL